MEINLERANIRAKELREHNSCISMMSDIASDCESMFRDRLNAVSPSRCFMCHVKGCDSCQCRRCKLCLDKSCNMNCYVDDGRTYWCDYD